MTRPVSPWADPAVLVYDDPDPSPVPPRTRWDGHGKRCAKASCLSAGSIPVGGPAQCVRCRAYGRVLARLGAKPGAVARDWAGTTDRALRAVCAVSAPRRG